MTTTTLPLKKAHAAYGNESATYTAENGRAEMRRIEELRRAGDYHTARCVRENLMLNALIAVYVGHPDAKAIATAIVGVP